MEFLKQKGAYPYEYMDSFKRLKEEKLLDEKYFYSSLKVRKTDDNGKKLGGHIGDDDYLTCNKIRNKLT